MDSVAPKVSAALEDVRRQYPPAASRRRPWTPRLWRRWRSRAPRAPLAGALLQGGGGVAHPLTWGPPVPSNLHECYLYILIYECMYMTNILPPPPRHGQFDRLVGHSPPPLWEIFCSTVCILFGVCYAP